MLSDEEAKNFDQMSIQRDLLYTQVIHYKC
jgi:hypothetical protein